ncbi:hypothetical protein SAMN02745196_02194 [Clostridium collagenovorans DSM 3089]|uniref:Uncharacterized protein n=1 Tax=Clostridium collagenovorans DSM 3089 TaxID=1121306 RepID=A0A1M5XGL9_9CLOT|nr:hypothetical protein SAMN02745196_02194 [Clostridium collagenovorans DSM 3089]
MEVYAEYLFLRKPKEYVLEAIVRNALEIKEVLSAGWEML